MERQEWFERFVKKLRLEEDRYISEPEYFLEEWKTARIVFLSMTIDLLPHLEKRIVRLVYFEGHSERKAAKKLKISRAKLQRRKKKALNFLKKSALKHFSLSQSFE